MSRPVNTFLGTLFGSADGSDCHVRFQTGTRSAGKAARPAYIGDPLPAHQLVLRGGSERFRAQIERWIPLGPRTDDEQGTAAKRRRIEKEATQDGLLSNGAASSSRSERRELPELMVPLDSESELQPAIAAIRFMYTNSVYQQAEAQPQQQHPEQVQGQKPKAVGVSVGELLRIRRQAEYLQVQGCTEACDAALVESFAAEPDGGSSSSSSPASPLVPVLELYSCRHMLLSPEDDPRVRAVLAACCKCLARHWEAQLPESPKGTTKAKVLVWLLGSGDTVRIANEPQLVSAWLQLPAAALEGLLQSDHLSTDDEATVVLLVEQWVAAQGGVATEADKARVRRQLRLVNCSTSYLFDVLPKLPWLGPNPGQQAAFMARCRLSARSQWAQHGTALGGYDTSTPWYGKRRPQSVPKEGVSYSWEVSREDLLAGLKQTGDRKGMHARFQGASKHDGDGSRVVALGFEWRVLFGFKQGDAHAGLYFMCHVPVAIEAQAGRLRGGCSVTVRLEVQGNGAAGSACRPMALKDAVVPFGAGLGLGWTIPLALEQGPGGQAAEGGQQPPQQQGPGGQAAEGGQQQQQQQGQGGQAAGGGQQQGPGGQAEGGGAETDAALLAPWAKLLGTEGKIRGVLTFARPA